MNRRTFIAETALIAGSMLFENTVLGKPISKKKSLVRIPILVVDVPNKNNRIYPRVVMEQAMEKYRKDFIVEKRALISKQLPKTSSINLMDTVGIVEKIEMENDVVFVEAEFFLNVNNGQIVETGILNGDLHLRLSGVGSLGKQHDGTDIVQTDYEIVSCFVTNNPA